MASARATPEFDDAVRKWRDEWERVKRENASRGTTRRSGEASPDVAMSVSPDSASPATVHVSSPDASDGNQEIVLRFADGLLALDSRRLFDKYVVAMSGSESRRILSDCLTYLGKGAHGVVAQSCATDDMDPSGCSADACIAIKFQKNTSDAQREAQLLDAFSKNAEFAPFVTKIFGQRAVLRMDVPVFKPKEYLHVTYMEVLRAPFSNVTDMLKFAPTNFIARRLPDIVRQVMRGLVLLHRHYPGVKHNDLSTNNVFLTGPDCERAVMGDWGLAWDMDSAEVRAVTDTVVLWDYAWVSSSSVRPVFQDYRHIGRVIDPAERFAPKPDHKAYMIPIRCQYYDWHQFMFWVDEYLARRNIHVPVVREIFRLMFDNPLVRMNPKYQHLVRTISSMTPFPGRLTGQMQLDVETAISEGRLLSLEDAYARLFE